MTDDVTNRLRGIRKQYFPHPPCGGVFADYCNCDDCQERPIIVEYQDLKFLLDELEHLRERGVVRDRECTCGSGFHPRPCEKHPYAYNLHVREINTEQERDELRQQLDDLKSGYNR